MAALVLKDCGCGCGNDCAGGSGWTSSLVLVVSHCLCHRGFNRLVVCFCRYGCSCVFLLRLCCCVTVVIAGTVIMVVAFVMIVVEKIIIYLDVLALC
jgi:hypothetical protein